MLSPNGWWWKKTSAPDGADCFCKVGGMNERSCAARTTPRPPDERFALSVPLLRRGCCIRLGRRVRRSWFGSLEAREWGVSVLGRASRPSRCFTAHRRINAPVSGTASARRGRMGIQCADERKDDRIRCRVFFRVTERRRTARTRRACHIYKRDGVADSP